MATTKNLESTILSIEVQNSIDKDGNPTFKKKNFNGIKNSANVDDLFTLAEGIKTVLKSDTRDVYLTECSRIDMN